jgi:hypothetical protein
VLTGKYQQQRELLNFIKVGSHHAERVMNGLEAHRLTLKADSMVKVNINTVQVNKFEKQMNEWLNLDLVKKKEKWLS